MNSDFSNSEFIYQQFEQQNHSLVAKATVRAIDLVNKKVTVEVYTPTGGGTINLDLPAINYPNYTIGDLALVLWYADDIDAAIILGNLTRTASTTEILSIDWQPLTLKSDWLAYHPDWRQPRIKRINDMVHIEGTVKRKSGASRLITTLPSGYRPTLSLEFFTTVNTGMGRLRINPNGDLLLVGGGAAMVGLQLPPYSIL